MRGGAGRGRIAAADPGDARVLLLAGLAHLRRVPGGLRDRPGSRPGAAVAGQARAERPEEGLRRLRLLRHRGGGGRADGTTLTVERNGSRAGTGTTLGGKAEVVVSLPKGRQTLRASATIGSQTVASEPSVVTVAVAKSWSTSRADGSYKGKAGSRSVRFKVAKKGKEDSATTARSWR